jgi:hypothetical protein
MSAAQEGSVQHPRKLDVIHEQRLAAEQPVIFVTGDG